MSMTGTEEQKQNFLGCTTCHTLERIVRSQHDAAEWIQVWRRMTEYAQGSTPARPQKRPSSGRGAGGGDMEPSLAQQNRLAKTAEYAATINLSTSAKWDYELKTLPRPKGKATRVIMTEYDLPRPETLPHDAAADSAGMIWYSDFGSHYLGMLDPKTGKAVEYPIPITKPGAPLGSLDMVFDKEGNIWMGTMYQGSL